MAAMRAVVALATTFACGALALERRFLALDEQDWPGATAKKTDDVPQVGSSSDGDSPWFGSDAAAAENAAIAAAEAAHRATEELDTNLTEHQIIAMDRHATSEVRHEIGNEGKLEIVSQSMDKVAETSEKVVNGLMRKVRIEQANEERKAHELEHKLDKLDKKQAVEDDKLQRLIKRDQMKDREEDIKLAREQLIADKQLKSVLTNGDSELFKENKFKKQFGGLVATTSKRLLEEANDLREDTIGNFSNGSEQQLLTMDEVAQLLDISTADLENQTKTFVNISHLTQTEASIRKNQATFSEKIEGLRNRSLMASAKMLETVKHNVDVFKTSHTGYNDRQFLGLVGRLINDIRSDVGELNKDSDAVFEKLALHDQSSLENLTYTVALALHSVTSNVEYRSHLANMQKADLKDATAPQACHTITQMVASHLAPAYKSLTRIRSELDSFTKVAPSISEKLSDEAETEGPFESRATSLINMAYAEILAVNESSNIIQTEAVPIIMDRLKCKLDNSNSVRPAAALAALAADAAAWLRRKHW